MKKRTLAVPVLLLCALLTSCAGLSERATGALDSLDVSTKGVTQALLEAPKIEFLLATADLNHDGRINDATEWFGLLSGLVTLIETLEAQ